MVLRKSGQESVSSCPSWLLLTFSLSHPTVNPWSPVSLCFHSQPEERNFCHWEQRNLRSVFLGSPLVLPWNSANTLGKVALPLLSPSLWQISHWLLPGVLLKSEENHSPTSLVAFYDMHQSLLNKVTKATQGTWTIIGKSAWLLKIVGNSPFHFGAWSKE